MRLFKTVLIAPLLSQFSHAQLDTSHPSYQDYLNLGKNIENTEQCADKGNWRLCKSSLSYLERFKKKIKEEDCTINLDLYSSRMEKIRLRLHESEGNLSIDRTKSIRSSFHRDHINKIVWSKGPLIIGEESSSASVEHFNSEDCMYGTIYLEKRVDELQHDFSVLLFELYTTELKYLGAGDERFMNCVNIK